MSLRSIEATNRSLDNDYGTTAADDTPTTHDLALFNGDPMLDGVEVTAGGYARRTIAQADWAAAAGGAKQPSTSIQFPDATEAWGQITHYALHGSDGNWWDCGPLTTSIQVSGAGAGPLVLPVVYYDDIGLIPT